MKPRGPLAEVLLVFSGVAIATFAITRLRAMPKGAEFVPLLVAAVFLFLAIRLAQREENGVERYGLALGGLLAPPVDAPDGKFTFVRDLLRAIPKGLLELGAALLVALIIFPPFAFAFRFWFSVRAPFALSVPPDIGSMVLAQLIVVALPEEAFFRGYVQTRLGDAFPQRVRVLGVELSPSALLLQSALFALVHVVVDGRLVHLAVFFPGLLFGFMRAWRNGIGAALILHVLCNIYSEMLFGGIQ
jgi:membrane protease YdiL (CAAX protease family)